MKQTLKVSVKLPRTPKGGRVVAKGGRVSRVRGRKS